MNIWDCPLLYHQSSFNGAVHKYTWFYCASFTWLFCFFFWIEELWQPHVKQFCWCHFFSSIGSLLSLCHILVILTLFQSLSKLWYLLLWSMINDLWGYYSNCFGFHELQLYEMVGLTDTFMFALTTLSTDSSPTCFSLLSPSYSLRYSDT